MASYAPCFSAFLLPFGGPSFAPDGFYCMTFGDVSANLLESYRNAQADRPDFAMLADEAEKSPLGADGLRLATANPGAIAGGGRGGLEPGAAADLIRFRWQAGAETLDLVETVAGGVTVMGQAED